VRFGAIALGFVLLLVGFGQTPYAGLTREEATALSREAAASFPQRYEPWVEILRRPKPVETFQSTNSEGDAAWLTIFRFAGEQEPDQACVWVWATPSGPWPQEFETVPTIADGRSTPLHERCLSIAIAHGFVEPEQTVGSEEPLPQIAHPEPVSPFGRLPRFDYLDEWIEPDALMGADDGLLVPASTAPGTWGLAGFLLSPDGFSTVPGGTIAIAPATPGSLLSNATDPPPGAVQAVTDEFGAFVFLNMPRARWGYEAYVSAPGHAPYVEAWDDLSESELYLGEIALQSPEPPR
jgi:hypothetical protein